MSNQVYNATQGILDKASLSLFRSQEFKTAFDQADLDASGDLTKDEYRQLLSSTGQFTPEATESIINAVFDRLDTNRDGAVSYAEFVRLTDEPAVAHAPQETSNPPQTFKRRVVKRQEVPVIRQVKVPVKTKKVVPCNYQKRIPVTRFVEVTDYEEVKEQYYEFVKQETKCKKVEWVEKERVVNREVQEPVVKERIVKKPVTRIDEVTEWQIVNVPVTKVVEVEGYKINTIEERRQVEYEVWEVFELVATPTGRVYQGQTRDVELAENEAAITRKGTVIYRQEQLDTVTETKSAVAEANSVHLRGAMPEGNANKFSSLWNKLDKNSDGSVSRTELLQSIAKDEELRSLFNVQVKQGTTFDQEMATYGAIYNAIDQDTNDQITWNEFVNYWTNRA